MNARLLILILLAPASLALFAGCVDCVEGPPVSARGITNAPSAAGLFGYTLEVIVTDGPGGAPLEGAGVVAYYSRTDVNEWNGPRVEVRPDLVLVEPFDATRTVESKTVVRLMTDAEGRAQARVPGGRIIGVVVAKDGYTEEWVPALAAGGSGEVGRITLPLYRSTVAVAAEYVWGPGAASTGTATGSDYAWDPHVVPFAETSDANRGYAARIVEMSVTINWTNTPTATGELGIGVGPDEAEPRYFADVADNVGPGAQTQRSTVSLHELRERNILGAPAIHAGAATDSGLVAPFGLPYALFIEARFDAARAKLAACAFGASVNDNDGAGASVPGSALPFIVGSIALAAIGMRRFRAA